MRITNPKYNLIIEMEENRTDVLIVENPRSMVEIVGGLQKQCDGEEGDFVVSENNEIIKLEKNMCIVVNPFKVDFNDRKILNKLYSELKIIGNEYYFEKEEINAKIIQLLDSISTNINYNNIAFNLELEWETLFKLYSIKLEQNTDTFLEKIIEYIKILSGLCSIRILCMINIKDFLQEEELKRLYEMAFYNKIQLLLIESKETKSIDNENIYIIDKDRCLIKK